jgi:hypothetical protein
VKCLNKQIAVIIFCHWMHTYVNTAVKYKDIVQWVKYTNSQIQGGCKNRNKWMKKYVILNKIDFSRVIDKY